MKNKNKLNYLIVLFCLIFLSRNSYSQEKLLSMKIVYSVPIMIAEIQSSSEKDSIKYDFIIDKRFWWQAFDKIVAKSKDKKLFFYINDKDSLSYDSISNLLAKTLKEKFNKEYTPEETQKLIENNIRKIQFEERWWYNTKTMLIRSEVTAFQPIFTMDSIILDDEDLKIQEHFSYPLGWIKPLKNNKTTDEVVVSSNIEFTMPIYNTTPYQWWLNHLEAEYSIPFLDMLISKAENMQINTYDSPSASTAFNKVEILKQLEYQTRETLVTEDSMYNTIEKDTIVKIKYMGEHIDYFRFGQKWTFDLENLCFRKQINYFAPVIRLTGNDNSFRGFYPLFYIRKEN